MLRRDDGGDHLAPFIGALAPFGLFGKDLSSDQFAAGYRERLERYGVEGILVRIGGWRGEDSGSRWSR